MGTRPKAVNIDTLRVTPMIAAVASAARPRPERLRTAAKEDPAAPRAVTSTARNATPSTARQAVNATPPTPASAPNRERGPSIPNSTAATTAASVPSSRS